MSKANDAAYEDWAENHILLEAIFWWHNRDGENELRVRLCPLNKALMVAHDHGYQEYRWYKPWTWSNGFITVG